LRNLAVINCDCDNVFDEAFVVDALQTLMGSRQPGSATDRAALPLCPVAYASGSQACLSGRLAYWASDFLRIGGYDEVPGGLGVGHHDNDLCLRLQWALGIRTNSRGLALTKSLGFGFKNRIGATVQEDRGPVKLENCNPIDLDVHKTWFNFRSHNIKLFSSKLAEGLYVRNLPRSVGGGAPNLTTPLRDLCRECAASTGACWAVTEARPKPARR